MATVKTYDEECHKLAKYFLEGIPDLNTAHKAHLLALEIQQVIEDEIAFMREIPEYYAEPPKAT